jgi:NAD(P)-dependent dehydrogenase (short-subunit alcohol dehydrogenase family)
MSQSAATVAVTGAGRGIGLAVVTELAHRGHRVLALVENEATVSDVEEATAGLPVDVDVLDVTDPRDFVFPAGLRILVNNAGLRREFLPIEHIEPQAWREVFEVNVFALAELSRRALPVLRGNGGGVICVVTSSAVLDLGPFFGAYRASKAAASAICEELRLEAGPFGVRIVEILPGPTQTAMAKDSISARIAEAVKYPEYASMAHRQRELLSAQPEWATPEQAATRIADAIEDDHAPMRHASDPIAHARLERWYAGGHDEDVMLEALAKYGVV